MSASWPNPLPYLFTEAPHSKVWMDAMTPTAPRSAWIAGAIVFSDYMPEPVGIPDLGEHMLARSGS